MGLRRRREPHVPKPAALMMIDDKAALRASCSMGRRSMRLTGSWSRTAARTPLDDEIAAGAARAGGGAAARAAARRRGAATTRFLDEAGKTVGLADLFGRHDTLVTYFWMFGPERERPCPMCTVLPRRAWTSRSRDLAQRVAFAVIGRSPVARQLAFARERGWRNLKFYATVGDDFARDYRGLAADGSEWPALDVWVRQGGKVRHFWGAELGGTADPGQDPRGAPDPTPLWNILDLTPAGAAATGIRSSPTARRAERRAGASTQAASSAPSVEAFDAVSSKLPCSSPAAAWSRPISK